MERNKRYETLTRIIENYARLVVEHASKGYISEAKYYEGLMMRHIRRRNKLA